MENLHINKFNHIIKFYHSILAAYRLDKLNYNLENVKIASNGGCHNAELFCIEDYKSV